MALFIIRFVRKTKKKKIPDLAAASDAPMICADPLATPALFPPTEVWALTPPGTGGPPAEWCPESVEMDTPRVGGTEMAISPTQWT